jgi:kumamolisin
MGTSAAAAFWSALVARINEGLKIQGLPAVGFLNSLLYKDHKVQQTFNSVAEGQNDPFAVCGYRACPAWNPCTGWGTPHGEKLLNRLRELSRGRRSGERF